MKSKVQKILRWIKCHIFNRHVYIKNNYGLDEPLDSPFNAGWINWDCDDNDMLGDVCSYYDCQHCDSFHISSNFLLEKETIERIVHLKKVYKLSLEKRIVITEKFKNED